MMKSMKSSIVSLDTHDPAQGNDSISQEQTVAQPQVVSEARDTLYKPHVQSGVFGASANLVNAIVGAGIIGIPYALKQSGTL